MHTTSRLGTILLAVAAAATSAGCGAITERAMETAFEQIDGVEGVDIDRDGENFSFSTDEGSFSMEAGEDGQVTIETPEGTMRSGTAAGVPSAVTDVLRLPTGFEAVTVTELEESGSTNTSVGGVVPGGVMAEVVAELTSAIEDAGLTIAVRSESAEFSNLVTEELDGPGRQVVALLFADGDEGVTIQLTVLERG